MGGSFFPEDVVASMEPIPKQDMGSGPLSVKSKLLISLADVFTSGFAVSSNSDGAAQLFKPEIKSKSLPIESRLPVSLSTFTFAVSLMHLEEIVLMSKDG